MNLGKSLLFIILILFWNRRRKSITIMGLNYIKGGDKIIIWNSEVIMEIRDKNNIKVGIIEKGVLILLSLEEFF